MFVVPHVHKPHRLHSQQFSVHVYSFNFPVVAFITLWLTKGGLLVLEETLTVNAFKEILKEEKPITSVITPHLRVIYI